MRHLAWKIFQSRSTPPHSTTQPMALPVTSSVSQVSNYTLSIDNLPPVSVAGPGGLIISAEFNGTYFSQRVNSPQDLMDEFAPQNGRRLLSDDPADSMSPFDFAGTMPHRHLQAIPTSLGCYLALDLCKLLQKGISGALCAPLATNTAVVCALVGPAALLTPVGFVCLASTLISIWCALKADEGVEALLNCNQLAEQGKLPFCDVPPKRNPPGQPTPGVPTPVKPDTCTLSSPRPPAGSGFAPACSSYCQNYVQQSFLADGQGCECCILIYTCEAATCCPNECCGFEESCITLLGWTLHVSDDRLYAVDRQHCSWGVRRVNVTHQFVWQLLFWSAVQFSFGSCLITMAAILPAEDSF